jgi:hypothetical protein
LATLMAYIFWSILKLYYSAKFYNLHFDLGRLGYITIIGILLYLISLLVANTDSLILNLIIKLSILLSYPILFFLTDFFAPEEKAYMKEIRLALGY